MGFIVISLTPEKGDDLCDLFYRTQECRVLPLFSLLLRFSLAFVNRAILGKSIQSFRSTAAENAGPGQFQFGPPDNPCASP